MSNDDIVNQLSWFITNEVRMPAGFTVTVIEEIEQLRAQVAELLPWAETYAAMTVEHATGDWRPPLCRRRSAGPHRSRRVRAGGDVSEKWEMWMFQEVRDELCDVLAAGGLETRVQTAIEFGVEALDGLKAAVNTLQANDEMRRLRAQVAELLPWVETSTYAPTALLARIDAGEFGENR